MARPTSNVTPRTPPTTPPAIAPAFELLLFELELEVVIVEELGAAVDDVDVDEPVDGVPSGLSFNKENMEKEKKS